MKEVSHDIRPSRIFEAESIRLTRPQDAIQLLEPRLSAFDITAFDSLVENTEDREKTAYLQAKEIVSLSYISLANKANEPDAVIRALASSRAHMSVYMREDVSSFITTAKVDVIGNPFDHAAEIQGHQAVQNITLAHLTGNIGFFHRAMELLDTALKESTDRSALTLAAFRKSRLEREFQKQSHTFQEYSQAYEATHDASMSLNQWERVATVNARYAYDALKEVQNAKSVKYIWMGIHAIARWAHSGIHDPRCFAILPKVFYKEITDTARHMRWRKGAPDSFDYTTLSV